MSTKISKDKFQLISNIENYFQIILKFGLLGKLPIDKDIIIDNKYNNDSRGYVVY